MSGTDLTRDNLRGGIFMVIAMAAFAGEDALIKGQTGAIPTGQITMTVSVVSILIMVVVLKLNRVPLWSRDFWRPAVLLRNLGEIIGGVGFITSLKLMPLSMASALFQTMPLVMTMGAALFLGEKVGWRRWAAIAVGFAGVLIILRPTGADFDPLAAGASALTVVGLSMRDLATRRIGVQVNSLNLSFWGMCAFMVSGLVLLIGGQQTPVMPEAGQMARLVLAACFGLIGYYLMILGTRIGEISAIMPYRYSRLVFALILGWLVFAERPDLPMILGSLLVVGAGFYTFLRERYHAFHAAGNRVKRR